MASCAPRFRPTILTTPALILAALLSRADAAEPRVLIDCADRNPAVWRYTTERPADDWTASDFDDRSWRQGKAGFGVVDQVTSQSSIGTSWTTPDLWLRKTIEWTDPTTFHTAALSLRYDEDVTVFLNGRPIAEAPGFNTQMTAYDVTEELKTELKPGENCLAVHVANAAGGQYIDLSLVLDPEKKPTARIAPLDLELLARVRDSRWSKEKAWAWYAEVGAIRGCNYLPRTAVNMTEMWQAATFDPATIDEELGWAQAAGYNSIRVFVQYIVWKYDPDGLKSRMERFLQIADKHHIRVTFLLFCDCAFAGKEPYLGPQDEPVPGVHNSGWVPSPGLKRVADRAVWPDLEKYIKDIVEHFAADERVLLWDLYNEPGNSALGSRSLPLAMATFDWARAALPSQPLTTGVWTDFRGPMSLRIMEASDVVSFHGYGGPEDMREKIKICDEQGRPVICTEWLRRQVGNTFESILPIFIEHHMGGFHWGLVAGRTQTYFHWGSRPGSSPPDVWQHDVFHADGRPYDPAEIERMKAFEFSR